MLEVSFCFVTDFELKVDKEMLSSHAKAIGDRRNLPGLPTSFQPKLPAIKERRTLVVGRTKPAALVHAEAPANV